MTPLIIYTPDLRRVQNNKQQKKQKTHETHTKRHYQQQQSKHQRIARTSPRTFTSHQWITSRRFRVTTVSAAASSPLRVSLLYDTTPDKKETTTSKYAPTQLNTHTHTEKENAAGEADRITLLLLHSPVTTSPPLQPGERTLHTPPIITTVVTAFVVLFSLSSCAEGDRVVLLLHDGNLTDSKSRTLHLSATTTTEHSPLLQHRGHHQFNASATLSRPKRLHQLQLPRRGRCYTASFFITVDDAEKPSGPKHTYMH